MNACMYMCMYVHMYMYMHTDIEQNVCIIYIYTHTYGAYTHAMFLHIVWGDVHFGLWAYSLTWKLPIPSVPKCLH